MRPLAIAPLLVVALVATAAAQTPEVPAPESWAALRVRYGAVLRRGGQTDLGPGLTYRGLAPTDFGAAASAFGEGALGGWLSLGRESFALLDQGAAVTSGALWRGFVGPGARLRLGPLEAALFGGYHYSQLPLFSSTVRPELAPVARQAVFGGARLQVALPLSLRLEAHGLYPYALSTKGPSGEPLAAEGFEAGAALVVPVAIVDRVGAALVAEYEFRTDRVSSSALSLSSSQTLSRFGVALELSLLSRPPPPRPLLGGLAVSVVDAESGAPLPRAEVQLEGSPLSLVTDSNGRGAFGRELHPGPIAARATLEGYLPVRSEVEVVGGSDAQLTLAVKKAPPPPGAIRVVLLEAGSAAPVSQAEISVAGKKYRPDPTGAVRIDGLPPGAVAIAVAAPGFKPAQEVAMVVSGGSAQVALELSREQQAVPATIKGLVRGAGGGRPIAAQLEIPEQKLKLRASEQGAFSVRVPGGTYRVIISAEGFYPQTKAITVRDGEQAIFNVDLHPQGRR